MSHWTEKWIGLPWSRDWDCAGLVRDVQQDRFGRSLELPVGLDWKKMNQKDVIDISRSYAVPISNPEEGDGVLMKIQGRRHDLGSHIGIYCNVDGNGWILHNVERIGVLFTPLGQLKTLCLEATGYYRWT